jgi:hypothetical protein
VKDKDERYRMQAKEYGRARNGGQRDKGEMMVMDVSGMITFHPSSFILHPLS